MLQNYLVIALRLLKKNRVFTAINVLGLSIGISCCILIALFINDELSYEKGFPNRDQVFRLKTRFTTGGISETSAFTSPPIASGLADVFPEIETMTRVFRPLNVEQHVIRYGEKTFFERKAVLVDSNFLEVFPYRLSEGNPRTALSTPASALISTALKLKIFGSGNAIDEQVIINSGQSVDTFRITGIVASPDFPSHLDADVYMSMNSQGWGEWVRSQTTWANNNVTEGYLKLGDPDHAPLLQPKFAAVLEQHAGDELRQSGRAKELLLEPLDDIRLYSDVRREASSRDSGNITYIYIVGGIGILILALACINFMNLTTARSGQRAGEVGIRKSMGADRKNLIFQFLGESMVIVVIAALLSFLFVALGLPTFNEVMQKQISIKSDSLVFIFGVASVVMLLTGLLSGSYPAFFLSSMKPARVLKGKSASSDGGQWLRKGLVIVQFVITIALISAIVTMQQQLAFIQNKSLGFNKDEVVMIPMRTTQASQQYVTLKEKFKQISGVKEVSGTSSIPSTPLSRDWGLFLEGTHSDQIVKHEIVSTDQDYFDMMGIAIIAGRDFNIQTDNLPSDTANNTRIIVNEESLRAYNIEVDKAPGATLVFEPAPGHRYEFTIIGVVRNFHQFSLHKKISPMLFMLSGERNSFSYLAASLENKDYQHVLGEMKKEWNVVIQDTPFETVFLTDNVKTLYSAEARTSTLLTFSTVIAILISTLGLYGLSVYIAERKTKEIGIRKVAGASVFQIVSMLSTEYGKLVLVAFLLSVPLGYYAMERWLETFAYRIEPGISVFLISGMIAFLISWATISFESFQAARKNPVDTLRS